jgi:hypothetical protein
VFTRGASLDPETGIYDDQNVGRFISEDRLRGISNGVNFYAYVRNSPINLIDPSGLSAECPCAALPAALFAWSRFPTALIRATAVLFMPTSCARACHCRGCGMRLPAWISDAYGSLTPSTERIRDFAILASAGRI